MATSFRIRDAKSDVKLRRPTLQHFPIGNPLETAHGVEELVFSSLLRD